MTELINESDNQAGGIVVFDRGLKARSAYDKFTNDGKLFVSRVESVVNKPRYTQLLMNLKGVQ